MKSSRIRIQMETSRVKAAKAKIKRALRVRSKLMGTEQRPRMSVIRTNKHIYVQLIDDRKGHTLASASTDAKELRETEFAKKSKPAARVIGEMIAKKAKAMGIDTVVFDRGSFKYHGLLAELADAAREQGLAL